MSNPYDQDVQRFRMQSMQGTQGAEPPQGMQGILATQSIRNLQPMHHMQIQGESHTPVQNRGNTEEMQYPQQRVTEIYPGVVYADQVICDPIPTIPYFDQVRSPPISEPALCFSKHSH